MQSQNRSLGDLKSSLSAGRADKPCRQRAATARRRVPQHNMIRGCLSRAGARRLALCNLSVTLSVALARGHLVNVRQAVVEHLWVACEVSCM